MDLKDIGRDRLFESFMQDFDPTQRRQAALYNETVWPRESAQRRSDIAEWKRPGTWYRANAGLFAVDLAKPDGWVEELGLESLPCASVRNELSRYRYKLGVTLTAHSAGTTVTGDGRGVGIRMEWTVPNSLPGLHFGEPVPVSGMITVNPSIIDPRFYDNSPEGREHRSRLFERFLKYDIISYMENHERDEWFRCDGDLVDDPHRTDRR